MSACLVVAVWMEVSLWLVGSTVVHALCLCWRLASFCMQQEPATINQQRKEFEVCCSLATPSSMCGQLLHIFPLTLTSCHKRAVCCSHPPGSRPQADGCLPAGARGGPGCALPHWRSTHDHVCAHSTSRTAQAQHVALGVGTYSTPPACSAPRCRAVGCVALDDRRVSRLPVQHTSYTLLFCASSAHWAGACMHNPAGPLKAPTLQTWPCHVLEAELSLRLGVGFCCPLYLSFAAVLAACRPSL
jgi:hypothetical protein